MARRADWVDLDREQFNDARSRGRRSVVRSVPIRRERGGTPAALEHARRRLAEHLRSTMGGGRPSEVMALLCGPSGSGKSWVVEAAARDVDADVLVIDALYTGQRLAQTLRTIGRGRLGRRQVVVFDDVEHVLQSYEWFADVSVKAAVVGMARLKPKRLRLAPSATVIYTKKFDRAASEVLLKSLKLVASDEMIESSNGDARQLILNATFWMSSRDGFDSPAMELRRVLSADGSIPEDASPALPEVALRNLEEFCDLAAAAALLGALALLDAGSLDRYGLCLAIRRAAREARKWRGVLRLDDQYGAIDTVADPSISTGTLSRKGSPFSSNVRLCI